MSDLAARLVRVGEKHGIMYDDADTIAEAADRIEALEAALGNISRMKMFPDDTINRMTLLAAIEIARAALPHP